MNKIFTILFLFGFLLSLSAQNEAEININERYKSALGDDIPVRFQTTLTNISYTTTETSRSRNLYLLGLYGLEYKISNRFSIKLESGRTKSADVDVLSPFWTELNSELRYFFNFSTPNSDFKKVNLNGFYVGGGYSFATINEFSTFLSGPSFRLGYQSRFLKRGYFDIGIDYRHLSNDDFSSISFAPNMKFGLAHSRRYTSQFIQNRCDYMRCHDELDFWLKIDFLNLLNYSSNYFYNVLNTQIDIGLESRLWNSNFSINHALFMKSEWVYIKSGGELTDGILKKFSISYIPELRFFPLKNRRILKGKSGKNLNGGFISVLAGVRRHGEILDFNNKLVDNLEVHYYNIGAGIGGGIQGKILKRFFYELKLNAFVFGDHIVLEQISSASQEAPEVLFGVDLLPSINFGYSL